MYFAFPVSCFGLMRSGLRVGALLSLALLVCFSTASRVNAQGLKEKAEAEGKLMFYATFNAADSKTLVAAGEFSGALTAYSQTFEVLKPSGAPVDRVYLKPVFANIHPTGIAAKARHPNAARLFLDFVLSKRGQESIRGMNRIPDRADVAPSQGRLIEGIKPAFAPTEARENFERYGKTFREIFGGR